jgi:hypothetical protein
MINETNRAFADCIGVVNNQFLENDPPVVGATYVTLSSLEAQGIKR